MCSRPKNINGYRIACRTCDECVATRIRNYVARAMAEKATSQHIIVVTLTYGTNSQSQRDGAEMFRYGDIRKFLASLRRQIKHHYGATSAVRFIAAGEQGERTGRCHWHVVLFSAYDLTKLGTIKAKWGIVTDEKDIITIGKAIKRRNWSMWPHGFTVFQKPDEGGMRYALAYALKDQFTIENSASTNRQARIEQFATGCLRMSKHPILAGQFLDQLLQMHKTTGSVPPNLKIKVPGLTGYWWPSGTCRIKLLEGIHGVNLEIRELTGRNAPQFSTLLEGVKDNADDVERLIYGFVRPSEETEEERGAREARDRDDARERAYKETRYKCGGAIPCTACLESYFAEELEQNGIRWKPKEAGQEGGHYDWIETGQEIGYYEGRKWMGKPHDLCRLRETVKVKRAFQGYGKSSGYSE